MSDTTMHCTDNDPRKLLGAFLRQHDLSAKEIARLIDCDPRSADAYRRGLYWPQAKHWIGLVAAFGRDLTDAVFHPDEAAARLAKETRELELQLARKRAALADASRAAAGLAKVRARHEDRSAARVTRDAAP